MPARSEILPSEIRHLLGAERILTYRKVMRQTPASKALFGLLLGLIFSGTSLAMIMLAYWQLRNNGAINIIINAKPTVITFENLSILTYPAALCILSVIIGLLIIYFMTRGFFRSGPWVIVTSNCLWEIHPNKRNSYKWDQFNGNIKLTEHNQRGNLLLELKTGKHQTVSNHTSYVPDKVFLHNIVEPAEVERICRDQIKNHNPRSATNGCYK